jgi:ATP-dependent DNA helicase RecG
MSTAQTQSHLNETSVTALKGVASRTQEKLDRLGIHSVQDLLFHLPLRYEDRTRVVSLGSLRVGDKAVVTGVIELSEIVLSRKRMLVTRISDGTGSINLRFFHFNSQQKQHLSRGTRIRCFGEVRLGRQGKEMFHPEYRIIADDDALAVDDHLTPVYPTTDGLHQLKFRQLINQALGWIKQQPERMTEWLPPQLLDKLELPDLLSALDFIHHPPPEAAGETLEQGTTAFHKRLAFEELLAQHLSLRIARQRVRQQNAWSIPVSTEWVNALLQTIPFEPTSAQTRVVAEIHHDLQQAVPMMRLLQGDVGSGKTLVAVMAALPALEAGYQVAMMVPTEILAEQHLKNIMLLLETLPVEVSCLTGRMTAAEKKQAVEHIASGKAGFVVGTHALFQQNVEFNKLAFVIVDEQHRFGVHQRLALKEKGEQQGSAPHQLIMTATPIPRTLEMTNFADLDVSILDEMPAGRIPVRTIVVPDNRRQEVMDRVYENCREGQQAYWVCTLIEESEVLQCQTAQDTAELLQKELKDITVGLVHGRMKGKEKEQIMSQYKSGEIQLLVATTVIEVGVDVPNASLMVIENAERLGLSQLHQLRGRVGRGNTESNCVLLYQGPLGPQAKNRLEVMRESHDGFYIAQKDLELRGPGEVLGTKQTGAIQFRIADIARDVDLLPLVKAAATEILQNYPERAHPLVKRWKGRYTEYASV